MQLKGIIMSIYGVICGPISVPDEIYVYNCAPVQRQRIDDDMRYFNPQQCLSVRKQKHLHPLYFKIHFTSKKKMFKNKITESVKRSLLLMKRQTPGVWLRCRQC